MRNVMTWAVAVGLILAAAGTAAAQGRGGGFMMGGPGLLMSPQVQEELKLTDDQKEKAREFGEKLREKMQGVFQDAQGDFQRMQTEMQKINAAGMKDVAAFLKPEQVKRLKGISWQQAGLNALANDEDLQKELKVTADQKEKLKKLAADQRKDMMELFQGGQPDREKMQALRKDYNDKAQAALTEDQRKTYKDLLGKPIELRFGRRGGQ
jgi:Spy/CpxP family protein refolding chaperone